MNDALTADHLFFSALRARDAGFLDTLLTDDFLLIDVMSGSEVDRATLLELVGSGQLRFEMIHLLEARLRRYPGTAVVTGRTHMKAMFAGTPIDVSSRYTHVYVEQQGRWRLATAQGTQIAGA